MVRSLFGNVIYSKGNKYVLENNGIRSLKFGLRATAQGSIDINNRERIVLQYMQQFSKIFRNDIELSGNILLIGLGVGTAIQIIKRLNKHTRIDVVEIDEEVVNVARDHFFLDDDEVNIIIDDAFKWLPLCSSKYDFIFIDIFTSNGLPSQLADASFIRCLQGRISRNGTSIINLRGSEDIIKQIYDNFERYLSSTLRLIELPEDGTNYRNRFLVYGGGLN